MRKRIFGMGDALVSLAPGALWGFEEETYESLEWRDEVQEKPSKEAVEAEIIRLQEEYDNRQIALAEAEIAAQEAKQSALVKLAKLGLTEAEARAVIGL